MKIDYVQNKRLFRTVFIIFLFCIAGCLKRKQELINNSDLIDKSLYPAYSCEKTPTNLMCCYGFINSLGEWIIKPHYEDAQYFSEGLAPVKKDNKWGFIDQTDKFVIDPQFVELPYGFSEGLARIETKIGPQFINRYNNRYFNMIFDSAYSFSQGRAFVRMKGDARWSIINMKGEVLVSNMFDNCDGQYASNGMAAVRVGNYYGFVDLTGKYIIEPKYRYAKNYSDGLALVAGGKNGESGFIDENENIIINYQFDEAQPFSEGLAAVRLGNKWGYINKKGKMIIQPQFPVNPSIKDVIHPFRDGLACVVIEGKYGYIDQGGNIFIKPEYNWAVSFRHGLAMVSKEKKIDNHLEIITEYINKTGRSVWEIKITESE